MAVPFSRHVHQQPFRNVQVSALGTEAKICPPPPAPSNNDKRAAVIRLPLPDLPDLWCLNLSCWGKKGSKYYSFWKPIMTLFSLCHTAHNNDCSFFLSSITKRQFLPRFVTTLELLQQNSLLLFCFGAHAANRFVSPP